MKQKRKVSVLIALMMMLTVFAVPSMAFGAGEDYYPGEDYPRYSYTFAPADKDKMPDYLAIGEKLDLNVVCTPTPADATINQGDWAWEVVKRDEYFKGNTSALATIDKDGVLTAKGEGMVTVTARNLDGTSHSENLNLGFIKEYDGVRIYPNKTAKLMGGYASTSIETYTVPTQVLIEKPAPKNENEIEEWEKDRRAFCNQYQGTYPVTAIREDAISSDRIKKFIVPDMVKTIGKYAMGYKKVNHSSGDPAKATYLKTSGVTIYGQSNNTAAAKYAMDNGFTYKNMNTGEAVTIKVTSNEVTSEANKPKKVGNTKAKAGKKQMTVTWKRDKSAKGYQITYAQSKNFKKGKKNITITKNKTTKKTIKKLKTGKTYYVKVRAYKKSGSKKVYGAYGKVKAVKVK